MSAAHPTGEQVGLLRLATAGSVDDGKSTLVGRLLYDSKSVLSDQLQSVTKAAKDLGLEQADLALLTDGLRAEREQGITIDVAYRYFATAKRRFILADTPGHVQYTRNMVTGASTAQLAVILVDARHGIVEQTRRHAAVAALLRVPRVVLAVNKIDLVDWDAERFADIGAEFTRLATTLGIPEFTAIPVSALLGDNVVDRSENMDWYHGPTLLDHLESVPLDEDDHRRPVRFPVQYVIRTPGESRHGYRGYAGRLAAGALSVGDELVVLPSGERSRVRGIDLLGEAVEVAVAGQSVTVWLEDDVDVSRGDLLAGTEGAPEPVREVSATVCHLSDRPLRAGDRVLLRHTTRTVRAIVTAIPGRLDIGALSWEDGPEKLTANDIATVTVRTDGPVTPDLYATDRETGSFLLIDPQDGDTLAAGMVGACAENPFATGTDDDTYVCPTAPAGASPTRQG
ncbi:sulfate adenylyltransferase subunit 1 [Kitasatospora sp. NPDC004240]